MYPRDRSPSPAPQYDGYDNNSSNYNNGSENFLPCQVKSCSQRIANYQDYCSTHNPEGQNMIDIRK